MTAVSYLKVAAGLALVGLAVFVWLAYKDMQARLETQTNTIAMQTAALAQAKETDKANTATIDRLKADAADNRSRINALALTNAELTANAGKVRTVVKEVMRNDPASRSLADTRLTDGMRDALNAPANH